MNTHQQSTKENNTVTLVQVEWEREKTSSIGVHED
jgi:hypothetical protein